MKSILQRILRSVSNIAHDRNAAQVRSGPFSEWPEPTLDPYAAHAMCFPPPRYRAEEEMGLPWHSREHRMPGIGQSMVSRGWFVP